MSLANVTVRDLPGTGRQKRKIHMDAHANPQTHTKSRKEIIHSTHASMHFSFLSHVHNHTHTQCDIPFV